MFNRRWFFAALSSMGMAGAKPRGVYGDLGLRPVLNLMGPVTTVGASKMWPEIQAVMAEAAKDFAVLEEVKDAVGERLAKLCGTEAAVITPPGWRRRSRRWCCRDVVFDRPQGDREAVYWARPV